MTSEEALLPNEPEPELRIVLLGRLGKGKTSSGKTILGEPIMTKEPKPKPCFTETCHAEKGNISGQKVVVIDTPGLFNPSKKEEEVIKEIKKSITIAGCGPHVFLIVETLGEAFTTEVQEMVEIICRTFGKNTMSYTMVLFTYGSRLRKTPIEEYIKSNENLQQLIIQCGWKYHVFDNKDTSPIQVTELLQKINGMVQTSRGGYYTNKMLEEAEKHLQEQQQKGEQTGTKRGPIQTSALLGTGAGCLMGYFAGGGEMTSTLGAALGAVAGGIMASGTTGIALLAKNHIKKFTGE